MSIIAWDRETNTAILPNRLPVDGEFARFKTDTHTEYKHFYESTQGLVVAPKEFGDIPIVITGVSGAVKHSSDFTWVTCVLGVDIDVEFDLAIGEARTFAMTLSGQRNTPDAKFFAIVDEFGKGKVTLNFDAMGDYVYTNAEANKGLDVPLFFTKPILIEVGKATGLMIN